VVLKSVASSLGTTDFSGVRIGIGRRPIKRSGGGRAGEFHRRRTGRGAHHRQQAADATELLVELGLKPAQNTVHAW
jgi:PTH1 family peptidyl-tRNA hydrolase